MEQSWPLFRYSRPFLSQIIISIVQIEKNVDGVLGFEPGATGWEVWTKPRSYGTHLDRLETKLS